MIMIRGAIEKSDNRLSIVPRIIIMKYFFQFLFHFDSTKVISRMIENVVNLHDKHNFQIFSYFVNCPLT